MSGLREVNDQTFEQEVLLAPYPVLVDFAAEWCGPCKAIAPLLSDIAEEYEGEAEIVTVDIDKSPQLRDRYNIKGVPTFVMFKGGQAIETQVGGPGTRTGFAAIIDRGLAQ